MKIKNVISKFTVRQIAMACLLIAPLYTSAAIYLHLENIQGEVVADGYQDWIELNTVSEQLSVATNIGTGGGRETSAPNFGDITVSKLLDRSSPLLRQRLTEGKHIGPATIVITKAGAGGLPVEFFRIELTNTLLTSISMSSVSGGIPEESVSITFDQIVWEYRPIDNKGGSGAPVRVGYDLTTNKKI